MKNILRSEDIWALLIGGALILFGLLIFFVLPYNDIREKNERLTADLEKEEQHPYKTVDWYHWSDAAARLSSGQTTAGKRVREILATPEKWQFNPLISLYKEAQPEADIDKQQLSGLERKARDLHGEVISRGDKAGTDVVRKAENASSQWYTAHEAAEKAKKSGASYNLFRSLPVLALLLGILFAVGAYFMKTGFLSFLKGFAGVFSLSVLAFILGGQRDISSMGFGYPLWGIVLGMLISNTTGTPSWLQPAVKTEYYIKTGLVLLGAEILFGKILSIGLPGLFVAWIVTPIVLVVTYWFGQKVLKITSRSLNITISADMSVCGVSAAIATAAASGASREELTLAVGLSMIFTSVMMVVLPGFINLVGMPEVLGGAWIGGTIDATGAVVAAGAFLGETALQVAATIKMIQNMLIGVIAFFVAYYFTRNSGENSATGSRLRLNELWLRFPKFIIGFVGASVLVSLLYHMAGDHMGEALVDRGLIRSFTKDLRGWLFCLAFVSIGLSVNIRELRSRFSGGKPLVLYACGQALNLLLTLGIAYLMFYIVFPEITEQL
ncbi:YeiH family protein [Sinomicrobium soli]|uniref:YeiH family protein n=1 Tax=Sinomicrobium sp. N-1-3-6 TaxID=2219864 RepID=UPI000DCB530E|nr:putative sulfate exporter family transporter [Sinomicrobium sp. N-1-3-6]RAV28958.1 putative sulfate exporter family transporter [Sinomicrobium sp. N-1-3-6]